MTRFVVTLERYRRETAAVTVEAATAEEASAMALANEEAGDVEDWEIDHLHANSCAEGDATVATVSVAP